MKFLIIHNVYSRSGGEEGVVRMQQHVLESHGHTVLRYERRHGEVSKIASFFTAIYNPRSVRDIRRICLSEKPDAAIIHNLFPVISAAVIAELKLHNIKVSMTLHNYRLICPNGLFYTNGQVCEQCGASKSVIPCIKKRCEGSLAGSVAWAMRSFFAKKYFKKVDTFLALTDFQRGKLLEYTDIAAERIAIIPNCIELGDCHKSQITTDDNLQDTKEENQLCWLNHNYIGFVGRLSPEKGIKLLFQIARLLPQKQFKVAGEKADNFSMRDMPENIELLGFLNKEELAKFYARADKIVSTSSCYETFPLAVIEAMYHNATVVVPQWAAFPAIVGDCGVLYKPNCATDLAAKLMQKYDFQDKPHRRVVENYNTEQYYTNIMRSIE